jgi:hypothetical protein
MIKQFSVALVMMVGLTGCSVTSWGEDPVSAIPVYKPNIDSEKEVWDALKLAATNADKSLRVLSEVNNAAKSEDLTYEKIREAQWNADYTPEGLGRLITFDWDGPIRPLMRMIESKVSYKVRFSGELPPVPLIVSVSARDKSVIDVIRDISAKTEGLIDLKISKGAKVNVIEVKYLNGF